MWAIRLNNMTNTFLPSGYEKPETPSNYLNKFREGNNKFRILSSAIVGYEYFNTDNKPVRSKEPFKETPGIKVDKNGKSRINHFWAFVVWDYAAEQIKIMEITQSGIQDAIIELSMDDNWGDPKSYDLNIKRTGKEFNNTKYNVVPTPPSQIDGEIAKAYNETKIDLEKLYTGEDPFGTNEVEPTVEDENFIPPF